MSTDTATSTRISALIRERLTLDVPDTHTDLIESGLLDSLAVVTLIAALEEEFACEFPLDDFDIESFRTVDRIVDFLTCTGVLEAREL